MASPHILSTTSAQLEHDTFIFATTAPTRLVLGLNQRLTPVSSATLHRWICLIVPHVSPFTLHPVTVHPFGILSYAIELNGEEVPAASTKSLPAGNYAWYLPKMKAKKDPDTLFDVVPAVAEAVRQRDHHQCFITGIMSPDDVGLVWVFPPYFFYLLFSYKTMEDPPPPSPEFFKVASNAGFMHKCLIPLFLGNAFSIDVDHFCVSLQANILGGDICEDYNHNDILSMMEELEVEGEDYSELLPLTDSRWQTVLGKAILEDVLLSKASVACLDDLDVD
ncbi:hypothetical protein ARMGADRAFT_1033906 [Armillaria gallica]|uniref:Uncharacterized protein n=1 Tax=Armillaria gallica TaxID=47427 RepID=A0A2H3D367_ARMGA|nr:hypothetical protein ARMGADRAFT_1033906 [Armillaria gallica]